MDGDDWHDLADDYGPSAILAGIIAFMLWIRTRAASRVITEDAVLFSGNDAWYHARIVQLTVRHFPDTPNFDPWSYFPYGTGRHSGFGGLFDQLIALVALIVGGGDPSPHLVDVVTAYAPVFFGVATIVPTYLIAKRLTDRWWGLVPPVLLALFGGQFIQRTVVGTADHQSAEAFFGTLAVLGFIYVVDTVYAEKPTTADIQDRNRIVLRRPVIASLLGGVAIASYLVMWPPGIMLAFTLGVFVVLQMIGDYLGRKPTEYLALGVAGTMFVGGVITLLYAKSYAFESTGFSLLQPFVLFGVGAGAIVMFGLGRYLDREGYERRTYPAAVAALIAGVFVLMAIVYPRGIDMFEQLVVRIYSFGLLASPSGLTVAEIQPANLTNAWQSFGAVFYVAVLGVALLLVRVFQRRRPVELLVLLWSLTMFSAYFTMIRFGYYVAVNVALLAGFAFWWTSDNLLDLGTIRDVSDVETFQIIGVTILLIAVLPGNVIAVGPNTPVWEKVGGQENTRYQVEGYSGTDMAWHGELGWMRENTPEVPLDYDRFYESPGGGDFEYPEAAYGVMSWWDYGHWITHQAKRIPNANPFQEGPRRASAYLLSTDEEHANLLLDALPNLDTSSLDAPIGEVTDEQLRSLVEQQTEQQANENTRYVVIDDQMATFQGPTRRSSGKFGAIATWTGPPLSTYTSQENQSLQAVGPTGQFQDAGTSAVLPTVSEQYRSTMLSRLYFQDATSLEHYRLVHESDRTSTFLSLARADQGGYTSLGINARLTGPVYRALIQDQSLFAYDVRTESRVKTYERVEGARLTGTANVTNESVVLAMVELETNTNRTFRYTQQVETDADGNFEMTVPYATSNDVGPEDGGTDAGVTATGNYTLYVGGPFAATEVGHADVPEEAIYEGDEFEVEFEEVERESGNETAANETDGTGTDGNETDTTDGNDSTGNESALGDRPLAPSQTATVGVEDRNTVRLAAEP